MKTVVAMYDRKDDYVEIKQFEDKTHIECLQKIIEDFGMTEYTEYEETVRGLKSFLDDYCRVTLAIKDII